MTTAASPVTAVHPLARLRWVAALLSVALGVGMLAWNGAKDGPDDPFEYFKTSALIVGDPLPSNPRARHFIDSIPPVRYAPHSGVNLPYSEFQEEYPPLALAFFLLPRVVTGRYHTYVRWFAVEMVLLFALLGGVLWRLGWPAREAAIAWGLFAAFASFFIARRFDAAPTFLAAMGLLCLLSARSGWAGVLLGLGAATKLWPGVLVPIFLLPGVSARSWRSCLKLIAGAAAGFLVPHVPFLIAGGWKAFSYLRYHGARGLQIESTWGNLAMVLSKLTPLRTHVAIAFGSAQVSSPGGWTHPLLAASYFAMVTGYAVVLLVAWRALRAPGADFRRVMVLASTAVVLLLLATAKVFSSQYVVWLFPFALLVPDRRIRYGALTAALLTGVIYPHAYYAWLLVNAWPGTLLVFARNVIIVWLLWTTIRVMGASARPRPEALSG